MSVPATGSGRWRSRVGPDQAPAPRKGLRFVGPRLGAAVYQTGPTAHEPDDACAAAVDPGVVDEPGVGGSGCAAIDRAVRHGSVGDCGVRRLRCTRRLRPAGGGRSFGPGGEALAGHAEPLAHDITPDRRTPCPTKRADPNPSPHHGPAPEQPNPHRRQKRAARNTGLRSRPGGAGRSPRGPHDPFEHVERTHPRRVEQGLGLADPAPRRQCGEIADPGRRLPDPAALLDQLVDAVDP